MYANARIENVHLNEFSNFIDCGPEEVDLSGYVDSAILDDFCKTCKLRRTERRPVRSHLRNL